jgi:Mycobacterium membrane protein
MSTLIGRAWVPMVIVVVVAVRSLAVSRLRGVLGSYVSFPDSGTADLIIQFEPTRVICEVYGPVGRVAAGALRCWSHLTRGAGNRRVTDQWRRVFR